VKVLMVSRDGRMALIEDMPWANPVIVVPVPNKSFGPIMDQVLGRADPLSFPNVRTFRSVLPSCRGDIQIYQEDGIHEFELDIYTKKRVKFRK
jgi:hypothetical protein